MRAADAGDPKQSFSKFVYWQMFQKTRYLCLTYVFPNISDVSLHHKAYYCINDQTMLQILREGANKTSCHKLRPFCRIFFAKEGKYWKENLRETSRMIFSLYNSVTLSILTTSFYNYLIVWWHHVWYLMAFYKSTL